MKNFEYTQHDFERRPPRNFVKENVSNVKQIQGLMHMSKVPKLKLVKGRDKFQNVPTWAPDSRGDTPTREQLPKEPVKKQLPPPKTKKIPEGYPKFKTEEKDSDMKAKTEVKKPPRSKCEVSVLNQRFSHRSVQTERSDDPSKLYETGVIKYASSRTSSAGKSKFTVKSAKQPTAEADTKVETPVDEDDSKKKDYIKENMVNLKPKPQKQPNVKVPAEPPPTYQKGVLPKYLLERKAEAALEDDEVCPPGHIVLPESERKETLRVLRQSYADRIQELNSLPVRSDTLRVKKKKMEIEEELNKIDSGIKIFQRSKVFVRINS